MYTTVFNNHIAMNDFIELLYKLNGKNRIRIEKLFVLNGMYHLRYTILPKHFAD